MRTSIWDTLYSWITNWSFWATVWQLLCCYCFNPTSLNKVLQFHFALQAFSIDIGAIQQGKVWQTFFPPMSWKTRFLPGCPFCVTNKSFFSSCQHLLTHRSVLKRLPSPVFISSEIWWKIWATARGQCKSTFSIRIFVFSSCHVMRNGVCFKPPTLFLKHKKCKMYMWGNEIRIFHTKVTKTQGPTMYTSTTVCSLCIVELQQRHSELVNGAITCNMSYLTKTLSHCHWMCFMSNKKRCFVRVSGVFLGFFYLEASGISCCHMKK